MSEPKVSIIIPVYNGANYLKEAIDSALSQTYKNIEIIVVNDGSQDNGATDKIALSYGDKIRYFAKENGGSSSALNYGIKMMTGDYFAWLSHDDLYEPERISHSVNRIDETIRDRQVIICSGKLIDANGAEIFRPDDSMTGNFTSSDMLKKFLKNVKINGCSITIPKNIIDAAGFFDEKLTYVNDADYWYRLVINDCIFTYFNEKLIKTRIHGEQVSVKKANLLKNELKILDEKVLKALIKKNDREKLKIFIKKIAMNNNMMIVKKIDYKNYNHAEAAFYLVCGKILNCAKLVYRKLFLKR